MKRCFSILVVALVIAQPAPAQEANEPPPTLEQIKARDKAESLAKVAGLPTHKAEKVSDIIQMSIKDKLLHVTTSLGPTTEEVLIQAPGLSGITTMRMTGLSAGAERALAFTLENVDFNIPDAVSLHTTVMQNPAQLTIAQDLARMDDQTHSVQLLQAMRELGEGEPRVTLYVQITGEPQVNLNLQAENMIELRRKYPAEVAKYVDPIFRTLRQEGLLAKVDSKLAWQVFDDAFEPSPELIARLKPLLAQLGAEQFATREAASSQLESLGQPAALALMRWDRKGLNDEQLGRIDAFVARFKLADDKEVARLKKDRDFLLDCLYSEDAIIRRRALQALQQVTTKPVKFDVDAEPAQRLAAIAQLRQAIGAVPATQAKRLLVEEQ